MDADALVRDYLGKLDAASWPLPRERRTELAGEVREHIEAALADAGRRDEVTVRNVLERLGPPEEIVAAEGATPTPAPAPTWSPGETAAAIRSPWGPMEVIAILLLTIGSVLLPFIGPLLGLVFTWASRQWTSREKTIASVIVLGLDTLLVVILLSLRTLGSI